MNPDLFSRESAYNQLHYKRSNQYDRIAEFLNYTIPSEFDEEPTATAKINIKSGSIDVECEISQSQMEEMVANFVRVFGIKSVLNATTSELN